MSTDPTNSPPRNLIANAAVVGVAVGLGVLLSNLVLIRNPDLAGLLVGAIVVGTASGVAYYFVIARRLPRP